MQRQSVPLTVDEQREMPGLRPDQGAVHDHPATGSFDARQDAVHVVARIQVKKHAAIVRVTAWALDQRTTDALPDREIGHDEFAVPDHLHLHVVNGVVEGCGTMQVVCRDLEPIHAVIELTMRLERGGGAHGTGVMR